MPIAFAISTAEANVVTEIQATAEAAPRMVSGLFRFNPLDIPAFVDALQTYARAHEPRSEEYRAAMRLTERLGTWVGQKIVARKAAPSPTVDKNQNDLFFHSPDYRQE